MTTSQPNPTDDLEAVIDRILLTACDEDDCKAQSRFFSEGDPYGDRARATAAILAALRPAGVGEAVAWQIRTSDGLGGFILPKSEMRDELRGEWLSKGWSVRALYTHPAHPDAALMERVRNGLHDLRSWLRCDVPAGTIGATIALRTVNQLLSDLKAESGR